MLISATVHIALVGRYVAEDPLRAWLMEVYAAALTLFSLAAVATRAWYVPSLAVLCSALVAYFIYVAAGRETFDAVGLATKAVEMSAVLLLIKSRFSSVSQLRQDFLRNPRRSLHRR